MNGNFENGTNGAGEPNPLAKEWEMVGSSYDDGDKNLATSGGAQEQAGPAKQQPPEPLAESDYDEEQESNSEDSYDGNADGAEGEELGSITPLPDGYKTYAMLGAEYGVARGTIGRIIADNHALFGEIEHHLYHRRDTACLSPEQVEIFSALPEVKKLQERVTAPEGYLTANGIAKRFWHQYGHRVDPNTVRGVIQRNADAIGSPEDYTGRDPNSRRELPHYSPEQVDEIIELVKNYLNM